MAILSAPPHAALSLSLPLPAPAFDLLVLQQIELLNIKTKMNQARRVSGFVPNDIIYCKGTDFLNPEIRSMKHPSDLISAIDLRIKDLPINHNLPKDVCDELGTALKAQYALLNKASTSPSFKAINFPRYCNLRPDIRAGDIPLNNAAMVPHFLFIFLAIDVLLDSCKADDDIHMFQVPRSYRHDSATLRKFRARFKPSDTARTRFATPDDSEVVRNIQDLDRLLSIRVPVTATASGHVDTTLMGLVNKQEYFDVKAVSDIFTSQMINLAIIVRCFLEIWKDKSAYSAGNLNGKDILDVRTWLR